MTPSDGKKRSDDPRRRAAMRMVVQASAGLALGACGSSVRADPLVVHRFADIAERAIDADVTRITVADRDSTGLVEAATEERDPAGRGLWWTTSNGGARTWKLVGRDVMSPEMFGATGQGDDAPAIDAAGLFLAARGGGTLRFRAGRTYRLGSVSPGTDISYVSYRASIGLPPGARKLRYELNGATLRQACDAYSFGAKYRMFNDKVLPKSAQRMTGSPSRGDSGIRLAKPASVAPGDIVMLVAGNSGAKAYTPIAEMLIVAAVNGSKIQFETPLAKDYRDDGRNPFGMIDINDDHVRDCAIIGPGSIVNDQRRCGNVFQALGFEMRNVRCEGRGGFGLRGRGIIVSNYIAHIRADWSGPPIFRPYALALDTGTCDVQIRGLKSYCDNVAYLHLHEGMADVTVERIALHNGTRYDQSGSAVGAISILGGSRNITVDGAVIRNNPQGPGIEARDGRTKGNRGLVLRNIRLIGEFRGAGLLVRDDNIVDMQNIDLSEAKRVGGGVLLRTMGAEHKMSGIAGPSG